MDFENGLAIVGNGRVGARSKVFDAILPTDFQSLARTDAIPERNGSAAAAVVDFDHLRARHRHRRIESVVILYARSPVDGFGGDVHSPGTVPKRPYSGLGIVNFDHSSAHDRDGWVVPVIEGKGASPGDGAVAGVQCSDRIGQGPYTVQQVMDFNHIRPRKRDGRILPRGLVLHRDVPLDTGEWAS